MTITLTLRASDDLDEDALQQHLAEAQVPFEHDDDAFTIACADDATADFWAERSTSWGAEVERDGEPEQQPIEREADEEVRGGANEVLPGDAEADVQPS